MDATAHDAIARAARRAALCAEQALVAGVLAVAALAAASRPLALAAAAALAGFGTAALGARHVLRATLDAAIASGRADGGLPLVSRRIDALRCPRHRRAVARSLEASMARADRELAVDLARILLGLERAGDAAEPAALARVELLVTRAAGPAAAGPRRLRDEARRLAAQLESS